MSEIASSNHKEPARRRKGERNYNPYNHDRSMPLPVSIQPPIFLSLPNYSLFFKGIIYSQWRERRASLEGSPERLQWGPGLCLSVTVPVSHCWQWKDLGSSALWWVLCRKLSRGRCCNNNSYRVFAFRNTRFRHWRSFQLKLFWSNNVTKLPWLLWEGVLHVCAQWNAVCPFNRGTGSLHAAA